MPPKGSKKPKVEETPTPKAKPKPTNSSPRTSSPRKTKEPVIVKSLPRDNTMPIDVTFDGESSHASRSKEGAYGHMLKLAAPSSFTLVKSTILTEGEFEGCQAIIIRPAKAFPFLQLPKEARKRVYDFYFAPHGVVNDSIVVEAKRTGKDSKDLYAKSYADGSKKRVALLAVNKEIYEEAVQIFYANNITFESTTTLLDFLVPLKSNVRARLTDITVHAWVKTTSKNAMTSLAEARNVKSLCIDSGIVSTNTEVAKAAQYFYGEAAKFIEAVAAAKGDKAASVDVITFGPKALLYKDDKGTAKPWPKDKVAEFRDALKAKIK